MKMYMEAIFVALLFRSLFAQKNNIIDKTSLILKDILQGYDRRAIPSQNGEAVQVVIELVVTSRLRLNHIEKHYSLVLFLRERWKDYRLSYGDKYSNFSNNNYIVLGGNSGNSIWLPDITFSGVRKLTHFALLKPNLLTRIYADGRVLHSRNLLLHAKCEMSLQKYPFSRHDCKLVIKSYAYERAHLQLNWYNKPLTFPVSEITKFHVGKDNSSKADELYVIFQFQSAAKFHFLYTFLLYFLIVSLSWISFWVNHKAVSARVSLGVTTILTLCTLYNTDHNINKEQSADYFYFLLCIVYLFASLIEFVFVGITSLKWKDKSKKEKQSSNDDTKQNLRSTRRSVVTSAPGEGITGILEEVHRYSKEKKGKLLSKHTKKAIRKAVEYHRKDEDIHFIDKFSRFLFPISFFIINIIFFIYYNLN